MNPKRAAAAITGIAMAVSLSACSSTEDTADANAAFCTSVTAAQTEVASLKALVATDATVEEVQDQRDAVTNAVENANNEIEGLSESVQADVEAADQEFLDAVEAIPTDAPLSEARDQYQAAIDAWDQEIVSIKAEVGCS